VDKILTFCRRATIVKTSGAKGYRLDRALPENLLVAEVFAFISGRLALGQPVREFDEACAVEKQGIRELRSRTARQQPAIAADGCRDAR